MLSETAGFGKFAASPCNNFIAICDAAVRARVGADADGIFVSYMSDTLHYAGVNVYSLRLVATDGRLRRRTSRRNAAPASGYDKCPTAISSLYSQRVDSHSLATVLSRITYGENNASSKKLIANATPRLSRQEFT